MASSKTGLRARVQLCGRLAISVDGRRVEAELPGRQGRMLFAFLATRPTRTATRDELIDAIWAGDLPSAPELALSALLSKLRRTLGDEAVLGRGEVALAPARETWVDVECARNSIHRAESLISAARWWDAYGSAVTARYISERTFLRSEAAPWIDAVRAELEEIHARATECDARIGLAVGGHEGPVALRSARRLIELEPYRESGYRLLMEALEREGNVAEAMRVYDSLRSRLREELGTAPSAEVQAVYERLLARA
jgi:DNA-binding SARP family transcriptional activator